LKLAYYLTFFNLPRPATAATASLAGAGAGRRAPSSRTAARAGDRR